MIIPSVDRLRKVNMQIVTMPVPAQDGITRDNVTVRVDAVISRWSTRPTRSSRSRTTASRSRRWRRPRCVRSSARATWTICSPNQEKLNPGLELMIDSPAMGWGVQIDQVEIKDVSLPETMKRSMARQAEADRERRARIINADAELQASKKLAEAAGVMSEQPAALQLRLLQTVVAVAARRTPPSCSPSRWNCCGSWNGRRSSRGRRRWSRYRRASGPTSTRTTSSCSMNPRVTSSAARRLKHPLDNPGASPLLAPTDRPHPSAPLVPTNCRDLSPTPC